MKRRQILMAGGLIAGSAVAAARDPVSLLSSPAPGKGPVSSGATCAMLSIEVDQRDGPRRSNSFELVDYLPAELASGVTRIDFDLLLTGDGIPQRQIYVWQARRWSQGAMLGASGLRMQFEDDLALGASVTVLDQSGIARRFGAEMPRATLMAFVTARRSTGVPPGLMDLRYDSSRRLLTLSDGSPRDFETLLVRTS